ncbi:MAG: VWA domain-containing protein [Proteobacteria bacterium]|nr:VWA domain-containing protein [Pseudomonadota bacterium]MBU4469519.1 VWA domain-containing protein [Pseudomonadota bacterium]MCG2753401.1 VWA domain-containing protein [Desulfobacteraceae bacterium]
MKTFSYSEWDGRQSPFSMSKKDVVDKFMENILKGMNPNMSLADMLWNGFPMAGRNFRVMGLAEMIRELEKQKNELFSKYNLEKAFDTPMDEVKSLLEREAQTRRREGLERSPSYDELPPGLMEKLNRLKNFDFQNEDSRELFEKWKSREKDILDLYEFYGQYADQFTGEESLDFDQAVELMRRMQALENLQKQMLNGQLSKVDLQQLQQLLGENAEKSMNILLQLPKTLNEEGITDYNRRTGFTMTPRGMRKLGESAFGKIYQHVKKDRQGNQAGDAPQSGEMEPDSSRQYEFGDRMDLDITKTLLKAITKSDVSQGKVQLSHEDIYVREREQLITSTTVILLDLSWSMSWEGRFEAGKKVALALDHYIKTRFPRDKFHVIGFSTEARELTGNALAMAVWDADEPYTNLQGGLRLAMKLIKKSGNRNNRVIVITDGQPTAYYEGEHLYVELPDQEYGISPNAVKATLAEVRKVTAQGMNIETFMLDNNPVLVEFTHTIAKINRGRAVMCMPDDLGNLVFVEEIKRRGGKI